MKLTIKVAMEIRSTKPPCNGSDQLSSYLPIHIEGPNNYRIRSFLKKRTALFSSRIIFEECKSLIACIAIIFLGRERTVF